MARRLGDEATLAWLYPVGGDRQLAPGARRRSARRRPRRSCARRSITPTTARSCGPTCTGSATRCRTATSPAPTPISTARGPVAHATRRSFYRWHLMVAEAARAAFAGRLDEAERMTEEALALNRRHGDDCYQEYTVAAARARAAALAPAGRRRGPAARVRRPLPASAGVGGDARVAGVGARQRRGRAPRGRAAARATTSPRSCARPTSCPPPCAWPRPRRAPGSREQVERLYALLLPYAESNPVLEQLWAVWGPAARGARAAGRGRRPPADAAAHFAEALRLARGVGRARLGAADDRRLARDRHPRSRSRRAGQPRAAAGARARASGRRRPDRRRGSDHHAVALDHGLRPCTRGSSARSPRSPQSVPQLERRRKWSGP